MSLTLFISYIISSVTSSTILTVIAVTGGMFILEDPTTILIGVLVADGQLSVTVALVSLYIGILLGDLGLYGLGYLASKHPRLARFIDHDAAVPFRTWLETRYVLTIFSVRFIPGLRLPTYTASGFFHESLSTFFVTAVGATFIWTTLLFYAFYWFGALTSGWLSWVRYGIAAFFILILFFAGRYNLRAKRPRKTEEST